MEASVKDKQGSSGDLVGWESVKLPAAIVARARKFKQSYGLPVGRFFEQVANKELDRIDAGEHWMSYAEWVELEKQKGNRR